MDAQANKVVWAFAHPKNGAEASTAPRQLDLFWSDEASRGYVWFVDVTRVRQSIFLARLAAYRIRTLLDIRPVNSFDLQDYRSVELAAHFKSFGIKYAHFDNASSIVNAPPGQRSVSRRSVMIDRRWVDFVDCALEVGSVGVIYDQESAVNGEVDALRGFASASARYRGEIVGNRRGATQ